MIVREIEDKGEVGGERGGEGGARGEEGGAVRGR